MCPSCNRPAERSTRLIEGHTVLACRQCRQFSIEGSGQWVPGGPGWKERLLDLVKPVEEAKNIQDEIRNADETDPRWSSYETFY